MLLRTLCSVSGRAFKQGKPPEAAKGAAQQPRQRGAGLTPGHLCVVKGNEFCFQTTACQMEVTRATAGNCQMMCTGPWA